MKAYVLGPTGNHWWQELSPKGLRIELNNSYDEILFRPGFTLLVERPIAADLARKVSWDVNGKRCAGKLFIVRNGITAHDWRSMHTADIELMRELIITGDIRYLGGELPMKTVGDAIIQTSEPQ